MHRNAAYNRALRAILQAILCCGREPEVRFTVRLGTFSLTFTGDFTMQLPDNKSVTATVSYTDVRGNPAVVQGAPVWASDNAAVATVTAAADGMSAVIAAVGPLGSAQISVTADADLGEGVTEVIGLGTVEVIASEAVAAVINFGEPQ
jgi:hypothetical protein